MPPVESSPDNNETKAHLTSWILNKIRQHMSLYGYKLLDLPIIDSADLFLVKAGDQIINSLFTFERYGKQFALRPEFTASASDYFIRTQTKRIVRWQFAGAVFEDKFQEHTHNFEELGIGAELIGLSGSLPEAEIIAMSASGLEAIGVENIQISIGHIGLIREILHPFNLDARSERFLLHQVPSFADPLKGSQWVLEQFDRQFGSVNRSNHSVVDPDVIPISSSSATMGGRTQEDIIQRLKLKKQRYADRDKVIDAIDLLGKWCQISGEPTATFKHLSELVSGNDVAATLLNEWQNVVSLLNAHDIAPKAITIKPDLARSWEYYTGIVFDLFSDGFHLGGGGRYDELARLVGSLIDVPSVGFAYYGNQLMTALKDVPLVQNPVVTISVDPSNTMNAALWANNLRARGTAVQIIPQATIVETNAPTIFIDNSAIAQFQMRSYKLDEIDLLLKELK